MPHPSVTVRPATPADAEQVVRINTRTWQHAYRGMVPDDVLAGLDGRVEERVRRSREHFSDPDQPYRTVVAELTGDPPDRDGPPLAGYASYGPHREDQDWDRPDPTTGEVLAIYVDPPYQGRGVGRALMDAAVAALRAGGAGEVRLWVLTENAPSRRFYERYGFVADGTQSSHPVERSDGTRAELPEVRYTLPAP